MREGYLGPLLHTARARWLQRSDDKDLRQQSLALSFSRADLESLIRRTKVQAVMIQGNLSIYANRRSPLMRFQRYPQKRPVGIPVSAPSFGGLGCPFISRRKSRLVPQALHAYPNSCLCLSFPSAGPTLCPIAAARRVKFVILGPAP